MPPTQKPIEPNPPRWKSNSDPKSIVVPGLDTEASTNIDENFSKIHNLLATKLLPAVKRYAVGTEPVREAAKFWTSFYEQAAQIRIPTFDDYSTVNEMPSDREESEQSTQDQERTSSEDPDETATRPRPEIYETSVVNSETSFMPGQGAVSSTPATARLATAVEEPSWTQSLESPMVRLTREINNLSKETDDSIITPSTSSAFTPLREDSGDFTLQQDMTTTARSDKGKGRDSSHPLLKNVLRHNLYTTSDNSSFENKVARVSPLKLKPKPKTPVINKSLNPYLKPESTPSDWTGVVDLRDPSVLTPQRYRSDKPSFRNTNPTIPYADDDDDSFDALPPGMSPPVLMSPARPPRSSAELGLLKLGRTPAKDATARIQRDLLRDAQQKSGGGDLRRLYNFNTNKLVYDSSMSTVPTPPSLSRYRGHNDYSNSSISKDSSLESMMRRLGNELRPPEESRVSGIASTSDVDSRQTGSEQGPLLEFTPSPTRQDSFFTHPPAPETPMYGQQAYQQQDMDSDSDSMDEINNTAHPSAAFLMASQGATYDDDSFGSSDHSSDSLDGENVAAADIVPVHPFASDAIVDDGFDDDSFDDNGADQPAEETIFGVAPAQRLYDARRGEDGNIRMLGEDLLQDTIGIGTHMAANGRVEESPTPASWAH
ncbi:hypothetical protein CVT26_014384 [Gymnopilus dilepis]|uniref:DASH complex subunit ASK1 n=1 Tax=Gymnopilus dilepis TaxID=231916 RepID=A0A409WTN1_9AGAR|nr:hypothetical protein CVT26_014384 [Gymnopilus dilepis]